MDTVRYYIYMLVHKDDINFNNIYIGSTSNFKQRRYNHKSICNNLNNPSYNKNIYNYIRENGGWFDWDMIRIDNIECTGDKKERNLTAFKLEQFWCKYYNSKLNVVRPYRTLEEHKEQLKNANNKWRSKNPNYSKEYYKKKMLLNDNVSF